MSKNGSQFIINLVKLPNGYSFESFHQVDLAAAKKKSASKDKPKNTLNRAHRIFRELALDPPPKEDLLNAIPEESEPAPRLLQPEPEEEQSVQIRREVEQFQSPAKWYDESSIHEIEKQSLPEFFNGRTYKTPGLYIKFRNFIVDLYRRNPTEYLTKIACRRILRGDVNTIMKIHRFLQKQGVINYCASKQGNYTFTSSLFSRSLNTQTKSSLLIDKVIDVDQQKSTEGVDLTNITVTTVNKCFSKSNRVFCSKCQSICGIYWFRKKEQNQKNMQSSQTIQNPQISSTVLCSDCYENLKGTQTQQYVKADIIKKIQSGVQDNKAVWSIDDNLKLLHFVSKPAESWQNLENQFQRKKNFDDIMLQFMQFPISNFEPQKSKPAQSSIEDPPSDHVKKMIERLKQSKFEQKIVNKDEARDLNCSQFAKPMLTLTKKLCQKMQLNIKTNLQRQNKIERSLYEISGMKTLTSKKIQNQQMPISESNNLKQKQFQEISEFNENQNEEDENDQQNEQEDQDPEAQENQGEGQRQLEDFMENLDYN